MLMPLALPVAVPLPLSLLTPLPLPMLPPLLMPVPCPYPCHAVHADAPPCAQSTWSLAGSARVAEINAWSEGKVSVGRHVSSVYLHSPVLSLPTSTSSSRPYRMGSGGAGVMGTRGGAEEGERHGSLKEVGRQSTFGNRMKSFRLQSPFVFFSATRTAFCSCGWRNVRAQKLVYPELASGASPA